jgi:cytochrome c556
MMGETRMRLTNQILGMVAIAALAAVLMLPAGSPNAASGEDAIKQRRELMKKVVSKNWKPIKEYAKDGKGTPGDVAKHAAAMSEAAEKIPALFPKGTGRGDFSDKQTRALPAIWKDWSKFENSAKTLKDETAELVKVAKKGDKDAIVKQIGVTGKACGGCHKPFRGAKAK